MKLIRKVMMLGVLCLSIALVGCQNKTEALTSSVTILNCKMKLELRNWDKGACPFIPIRAVVGPLFSIFV